MTIFVDADSCPRLARETVLRAAKRRGIPAVFVANRPMPGIVVRAQHTDTDGPIACMDVCAPEEGAADDRIVACAAPGDLVITRDIPLADRLVAAGVSVMDDRGSVFTRENIRERRSLRDFVVGLAADGLAAAGPAAYGKRELKTFADRFDHMLTRLHPRTQPDTGHPDRC